MKNIIHKIKLLLIAFFMIAFNINALAQQINSSDQCTISGTNTCAISLVSPTGSALTSVKSGLDFNLNLTLPGISSCNGTYDVVITTSGNLLQGNTPSSYPYPFVSSGTNQYDNGTILSSASGLGINIPFKFAPGVTCNDETGTFNVKISLTCANGSKQECNLKVSLKAIAQNYWVIEKRHVWGNLSGGAVLWDIVLTNTNPNPGIGDLNINSGTIYDNLSSGQIISVTGASGTISGLNTNSSSWSTGTILSTTPVVVYQVQTVSCNPAGTTITNCVKTNFCLGKVVDLIIHFEGGDERVIEQKNPKIKIKTPVKKLPHGGPNLPPYQKPCCGSMKDTSCATVILTGTPSNSANFGKALTYGNNLNYTQGCEGEYQIAVSNNGNIPLNNIVISDNFPVGINVTKITLYGSGVSMDYNMTGLIGIPVPGGSPLNTGTAQTWNYSSVYPAGFTFNTTGTNSLMGGTIYIKIRFTITTAPGTVIKNCASLNYSGTYNGWGNWCGVALPPASSDSVQSCVSFTVEEPRAIPGIRKCIRNGQQSFSVGDIIPFRIVISNHGALSYSGTLSDLLGSPQNLQLVSGSVTYSYGLAGFNPYTTTPNCISNFSNVSGTPPSWVTVTQQTNQNLGWNISGMPGSCKLDTASYLVIEFDAKVLPQSFGQYVNTATLGTLNSNAYYNVMRVAKISTTKQQSTSYVEPGQSFNYIITVKNEGSVGLKDIKIQDQLPACVTYNSISGRKLDFNGNLISSVPVAGGPTNFNFPGLILQPGESAELTITVTRKADNQSELCCNPLAKGTGTTTDSVHQVITDEDGPVCVKSSLCCDIEDLQIQFSTSNLNGGIVPVFFITGGTVPIQEIEISLTDYHVEYSERDCQPDNMGDLFGHIQPFVGSDGSNYWDFNSIPGIGTPALTLQTVVNPVNNSLTWSGTTPLSLSGPWNFNGLIALNFIAPEILNIECCSGKVTYCFKVKITDVNCNTCEKIVCGSFEIPKGKRKEWKDQKSKDQYKLRSLENDGSGQQKTGSGNGFRDLFKQK